MNHFEDIWNEAEDFSKKLGDKDPSEYIAKIKLDLDRIQAMVNFPPKQAEIVGEILFQLSILTRIYNINSAAALRLAIENHKANLLDPDGG